VTTRSAVEKYAFRSIGAAELSGPLLQSLLTVFGAALGYRQADPRVRAQESITRRHAERVDFRAFGAFDAQQQLVGFSYGYASQPGLWWREQVWSAMRPALREHWFADAFEVCELHVHPAHQGQHLGSQLHDLLVDDLPYRTALLSVMHRSERARQLYASRGWQTLIAELRFSSEPATPFSVLGRERASAAAVPGASPSGG
jgi:ribosomal protein S18 acetylase RimI-like enzyme